MNYSFFVCLGESASAVKSIWLAHAALTFVLCVYVCFGLIHHYWAYCGYMCTISTTDHIQQVLHFSSLLLLSAYLPFTLCLFASLPAAAAAAVSHSVGLSAI